MNFYEHLIYEMAEKMGINMKKAYHTYQKNMGDLLPKEEK